MEGRNTTDINYQGKLNHTEVYVSIIFLCEIFALIRFNKNKKFTIFDLRFNWE